MNQTYIKWKHCIKKRKKIYMLINEILINKQEQRGLLFTEIGWENWGDTCEDRVAFEGEPEVRFAFSTPVNIVAIFKLKLMDLQKLKLEIVSKDQMARITSLVELMFLDIIKQA